MGIFRKVCGCLSVLHLLFEECLIAVYFTGAVVLNEFAALVVLEIEGWETVDLCAGVDLGCLVFGTDESNIYGTSADNNRALLHEFFKCGLGSFAVATPVGIIHGKCTDRGELRRFDDTFLGEAFTGKATYIVCKIDVDEDSHNETNKNHSTWAQFYEFHHFILLDGRRKIEWVILHTDENIHM